MPHPCPLDWLFDLLTVRALITPSLLILIYCLGAVLIVALGFDLTRRLHRQLVRKLHADSR